MPLSEGTSDEVIQHNIREMIRSWEKTGEIHGNKVESKEQAMSIAEAAAYNKAGRKKFATAVDLYDLMRDMARRARADE